MNAVELHIDELILDGFAPGDHDLIGGAVGRELARLLAVQGVPPGLAQGRDVAWLDGGAFEVTPGSTGETIGAGVAKALYGGPTR